MIKLEFLLSAPIFPQNCPNYLVSHCKTIGYKSGCSGKWPIFGQLLQQYAGTFAVTLKFHQNCHGVPANG